MSSAVAARGLWWNASCSTVAPRRIIGWSLSFKPILGCLRTTEIPYPANSLAAPIPDRRRSLGVSIAPAQRMTSLEAYPAQSSYYGEFQRGAFARALHTISPNEFHSLRFCAFEDHSLNGRLRQNLEVLSLRFEVRRRCRDSKAVEHSCWSYSHPKTLV